MTEKYLLRSDEIWLRDALPLIAEAWRPEDWADTRLSDEEDAALNAYWKASDEYDAEKERLEKAQTNNTSFVNGLAEPFRKPNPEAVI